MTNSLNLSEQKISNGNYLLGISLGNKTFTPERILEYIKWGLKNTKGSILVLVPDRIHSVNYRVLNKYKPQRSINVALRKGQETAARVNSLLDSFPRSDQKRVTCLRWDDIQTSTFLKQLMAFHDIFLTDKAFLNKIFSIL